MIGNARDSKPAQQLKILIIGFSEKGSVGIKAHISRHSIKEASRFTDAKHLIKEQQFNVVILNVDLLGRNDIITISELYRGKKASLIGLGGGDPKHIPQTVKGKGISFISLKEFPWRLGCILGEQQVA